jgi:hypothetical protein
MRMKKIFGLMVFGMLVIAGSAEARPNCNIIPAANSCSVYCPNESPGGGADVMSCNGQGPCDADLETCGEPLRLGSPKPPATMKPIPMLKKS